MTTVTGELALANPGEVRTTVHSSEQEKDGTTWIPCAAPGHCPDPAGSGADLGASPFLTVICSPRLQEGRMLITLDSTRPITETAISDWSAMSVLTRWVNGIVSVGLNARMFVNATYR